MKPENPALRPGLALITGLGVGAGLMYLMDPHAGRGRKTGPGRRVHGDAHEFDSAWQSAAWASRFMDDWPSNRVLVDRVRSMIADHLSDPSAIHVDAEEGFVTLSGCVPIDEMEDLLACVCSVRGVRDVDNRVDLTAPVGRRKIHGSGEVDSTLAKRIFTRAAGGALLAIAGRVGYGLLARSRHHDDEGRDESPAVSRDERRGIGDIWRAGDA